MRLCVHWLGQSTTLLKAHLFGSSALDCQQGHFKSEISGIVDALGSGKFEHRTEGFVKWIFIFIRPCPRTGNWTFGQHPNRFAVWWIEKVSLVRPLMPLGLLCWVVVVLNSTYNVPPPTWTGFWPIRNSPKLPDYAPLLRPLKNNYEANQRLIGNCFERAKMYKMLMMSAKAGLLRLPMIRKHHYQVEAKH